MNIKQIHNKTKKNYLAIKIYKFSSRLKSDKVVCHLNKTVVMTKC